MSVESGLLNLAQSIDVLGRTPDTLDGMLCGLPETLLLGDEGSDTFSPYAVLGHLISGEQTDWIARMRIILEHGESVPFEPWDRFAFRNWEARPMRGMPTRRVTAGALATEQFPTVPAPVRAWETRRCGVPLPGALLALR